jgi:GntR family transcriptional regulator/MocR family aminotransferase
VLTAYELLVSEEFVYSIPGAGFFVTTEITWEKRPIPIVNSTVASLADMVLPSDLINFDSGLPALDLFPRSKWNHAAANALNEAPSSVLGYDDPQGRPELREALSGYLKRTRGIECGPEQIIITSGTKQGLTLVAKTLLNDKSEVWIEDPTNENVKQIFSYHTDKMIPFRVDALGIQPHLFPSDRKPTLIFVTPSHQFPMGGILPIKRRLELVEFARKSGCYILEDNYDSEFTYQGLPANSLFEFDSEHVIHAGMHIVAEFEGGSFPEETIQQLLNRGIYVVPVEKHAIVKGNHSSQIILGYASLCYDDMERGLEILKEVLEEHY